MSKIKLVYIDKDAWEEEVNMFYMKNELDYETCHEFICYNNVVSLEHDSNNTTICTQSNLSLSIEKKISSRCKSIIIMGFNIALEYIFLELIKLAESKGVDMFILEKSKHPLRSNVSMTIDLNEYDVNTDFDNIKTILENNLKDSLDNAKKSKRPEHANDLGILLNEEKKNDSLEMLFRSLGLDDFINEYESIDEDYYSYFDDEDDTTNKLLQALLEEETSFADPPGDYDNKDIKIGVNVNNDTYEITDNENTIKLNKTSARKLLQLLEVFIDD